ncbi:helix-hairpin-helix domain-containing protein [Dokdonia sp. Hel_I_53]|uniref:helix-hairpin-helix domain-containing protein n=1 Tax=Dokdonia sp. Hel_I_53 TaxID=1566287 RepID=UPI00119A8921|nr:helix-hairpin-helix domain-containing protein [Dokdonia sp. Hel_I_53]TVZ53310.1 helix-hairpin-helix protein [Dokdonia sp. Hel_I_53]
MKSFKSHVIYDSRKRRGILFFAGILVLCILAIIWYPPEEDITVAKEEKVIVTSVQEKIDSLKKIELESRKPKIFPFNPNYITDYKGYTLGMSVQEIDRLLRFRESGKWVNSIADFKKVTGVSDSLLSRISPYFKFPDWVTNKKSNKRSATKWKTAAQKSDLNSVTYESLIAIEGVTNEAATKIYQHLKKLGGYQVDNQIYDVYGVSTKIKRSILNEYTVKNKPDLDLINVNEASASELATVPLLTFDIAKEIVDYRILRGGITSLEELKDIEGMTPYKYDRIKLYLHID